MLKKVGKNLQVDGSVCEGMEAGDMAGVGNSGESPVHRACG